MPKNKKKNYIKIGLGLALLGFVCYLIFLFVTKLLIIILPFAFIAFIVYLVVEYTKKSGVNQ
jgi:CHASE2 domain-containing sensor protein